MHQTAFKSASRPKRRTSGWSPERRASHAAAIRRWKPWEKSTGPRTAAGKARAAQNAAKPHLKTDPDRLLDQAVRAQRRYLTEMQRLLALKKITVKNGLLKRHIRNRHRALLKQGRDVTVRLAAALAYAIFCHRRDLQDADTPEIAANDVWKR